jgi:hypothetical protein
MVVLIGCIEYIKKEINKTKNPNFKSKKFGFLVL